MKRDPVPKTFNSISGAAEFWGSHDSTDYQDLMEEVEFDVDIERHIYLVPVASNILHVLQNKAKSQGVSTETMVNLLLQQHTS